MNFFQRFMVFFLLPPLLAAAGEAGKPDANRVVVRGLIRCDLNIRDLAFGFFPMDRLKMISRRI